MDIDGDIGIYECLSVPPHNVSTNTYIYIERERYNHICNDINTYYILLRGMYGTGMHVFEFHYSCWRVYACVDIQC